MVQKHITNIARLPALNLTCISLENVCFVASSYDLYVLQNPYRKLTNEMEQSKTTDNTSNQVEEKLLKREIQQDEYFRDLDKLFIEFYGQASCPVHIEERYYIFNRTSKTYDDQKELEIHNVPDKKLEVKEHEEISNRNIFIDEDTIERTDVNIYQAELDWDEIYRDLGYTDEETSIWEPGNLLSASLVILTAL